MSLVIYPRSGGGVSVMSVCDETPIAEAARLRVPAGLPFRIVNEADIPADRTYREAWDADFSEPDGFGGEEAP